MNHIDLNKLQIYECKYFAIQIDRDTPIVFKSFLNLF